MLLQDHEVILMFKYAFCKFLDFFLGIWFFREVSRIE